LACAVTCTATCAPPDPDECMAAVAEASGPHHKKTDAAIAQRIPEAAARPGLIVMDGLSPRKIRRVIEPDKKSGK
jgi:hypothetical protein